MNYFIRAYKASFARLKTWDFWRILIIYFCVFSIIGHLIEWPYCAFGAIFFDSVSWSDEVLANPLQPFLVYGIGMVVCAILLEPLKEGLEQNFGKFWKALLAFFIISVFLGMAMELTQGFLQNQPDANGVYPLWDVHDYPGNILGQAWIVNDLFLGAVFTFATWHIHPFCSMRLRQLAAKSSLLANIAVVCVVVLFAILFVFTSM